MNTKHSTSGDDNSQGPGDIEPLASPGRRAFVGRTGKALYLVPSLTLLASATVSAQGTVPCECGTFGCTPCPEEAPAAPEPPVPDQ